MKKATAIKELTQNIGWTQRFAAEAILSENKNHDPEPLFKWAKDKNEFFLNPLVIAVIRILPVITLSLFSCIFSFQRYHTKYFF